jgi:hypothetical protein
VVDIVGLYLDPPDKAVVLCVDEKSQFQALDRAQPGLPMKKGRAQTMTHDYKTQWHDDVVAALDVKTGKVIGECRPRQQLLGLRDRLHLLIALQQPRQLGEVHGHAVGLVTSEHPGPTGGADIGSEEERPNLLPVGILRDETRSAALAHGPGRRESMSFITG